MARIPALDGIRGLAIIAVVVAHYFAEVPHGFHALLIGWGGVELFFVLSGFLIGGILLDNRDGERFFSTFYIRRAFRIFPIYYAVLVLVLLTDHWLRTAHSTWVVPSLTPLSYFTYTQNFVMSLTGKVDGFWLLPTWTLAVEEQFYLLLPLLIYFVPRRQLICLLALGILSAPALRAFILLHGHIAPIAAFSLLPCRWDSLFLGVLAAYAVRQPAVLRTLSSARRLPAICAAGALGTSLSMMVDSMYGGTMLFNVIGLSTAAVFFAALLIMIVTGSALSAFLQSSVLRGLGRISYCLYLVHQPISAVLHGVLLHTRPDIASGPQIAVTVLAIVASIAFAWLSWTFFESRLVELGHSWTYASRKPVLAAVSV